MSPDDRRPSKLGRVLRAIIYAIVIAFVVGFVIGTILRQQLERPTRYIGARATHAPTLAYSSQSSADSLWPGRSDIGHGLECGDSV